MPGRGPAAGFIAIPVFIKLWAGEDCSTPAQNCKNISFYAYRRLFAFPYISVTVASLCKSPLLRSGCCEAGSSDNMHSGDSLQEELRATVLGVFLQVSISEAELITKQSPGPMKQHLSEAMATPGKSNSRTNSNFMGYLLIWVLRKRLTSRCIQPFF